MTDLFEPSTAQRPTAPPSRARSSASKRAARKRRRRRQQRTAVIMVVLLGLLGAGGYIFWDRLSSSLDGFDLALFNGAPEDYEGPGADPVQVVIPEGATGSQMGQVLAEADVVASVGAFNDAFESAPGAAGIQPGTYELHTQMSASGAVEALLTNEKVETEVTIPEGYTVEQVVDRVASITEFSREAIEEALADPKAIGLPKAADGNAEGWLFPKTYNVQPDDEVTDLLSTMIDQTKAELDSLGVDKDDRQDVLTKASIVEKEAPDGYRGEVARVIENRLDRGSPLGMDAVDAYGRQKPADQITVSEFNDSDFPYASRQQVGLPPTPISNPGVASVEAVIDPPEGGWIWYVTVNLNTGETKFTDNYSEFEQFKSEYQAWQAENN
ncbi:endolytic transglycosylase MltG [Isoptericola rhizosphaerae]|uniref:endolytic transglycosylase MltG n=1 Tax=Isoptericola rhizosphaerae TaxID=3377837 RepID=UPI00383BA896